MRKLLLSICLIIVLWAGLAQAWTEPRQLTDHLYVSHPQAASLGRDIYLTGWRGAYDFPFLSSWNNGFSWSEPTFPADTFYAYAHKVDIKYTPNGPIHVIWLGQAVGHNGIEIFHQSSSNGGRSWSRRHVVFDNNNLDINYPRIANCGDTLFLVCSSFLNLVTYRSFDNGLTWQDRVVVDSSEGLGYPPTILYSQGRLHLIYQLNISPGGIKVYYSRSDDGGLSWTPHVYLSSYEQNPSYASQWPVAYADDSGHIIATWFDYQYGSYCSWSGDILGRVSTDNGDSWLPETRLTYNQSGEASSCLILDNIIYVAWMDDYPLGCDNPKLMLSTSPDWGLSWSNPEVITGRARANEQYPLLLASFEGEDTLIHCFYDIYNPSYGADLYYVRNKPFLSRIKEKQDNIPVELSIKAYPNVFNSITTISYHNNTDKEASIEIYNLLGQKVWDKELLGKEGSIIWDARDKDGNGITSGVYFAKIEGLGSSETIKLILLK